MLYVTAVLAPYKENRKQKTVFLEFPTASSAARWARHETTLRAWVELRESSGSAFFGQNEYEWSNGSLEVKKPQAA